MNDPDDTPLSQHAPGNVAVLLEDLEPGGSARAMTLFGEEPTLVYSVPRKGVEGRLSRLTEIGLLWALKLPGMAVKTPGWVVMKSFGPAKEDRLKRLGIGL